jgi:hypothetical protein
MLVLQVHCPSPHSTSVDTLTIFEVYQKGRSGHASLGFDVKPSDDCETTQTGKFGIYVPDLGEEYGRSEPIYATKGTSWPHFYVSDGYINPRLTAASQQWYGE